MLDQTALNGLAGVKTLELVSSSSINLFGNVTLGNDRCDTGQPILGSLILDSAGVVATTAGHIDAYGGAGDFPQNSLGGTIAAHGATRGNRLVVNASDVLDTDPSGTKTGMNNATISSASARSRWPGSATASRSTAPAKSSPRAMAVHSMSNLG